MSGPGLQGLKLLLVEDEYLIALYLSELCEALGAEVLGPVACVDDALEVIRRAPEIDAAVLDVNLGGDAVYPVADALVRRQVPFIFASGYEPEQLPPRFRGIDVCRKPIDAAELRSAVSRLRQAA